jgi:hypothetical protein
MYNCINQNADSAQINKKSKSISSLTDIAEIQEDHLKHLDIEIAKNSYFYIQSLIFNPTILVTALFFILGHILGGCVTIADGDWKLYYNYEHTITQQFMSAMESQICT